MTGSEAVNLFSERGDGMYGSPWIKDGWEIATDCRVAARFPTTEPDTPNEKKLKRPDVSKVIRERSAADDWKPWPFERTPTCDRCGGFGVIETKVTCSECRGLQEYDCCECGQPRQCEWCEDGKETREEPCGCAKDDASYYLPVGETHKIDPKYLRRISRLEDVTYAVDVDLPGIVFRFAGGGEGVCMAMEKRS